MLRAVRRLNLTVGLPMLLLSHYPLPRAPVCTLIMCVCKCTSSDIDALTRCHQSVKYWCEKTAFMLNQRCVSFTRGWRSGWALRWESCFVLQLCCVTLMSYSKYSKTILTQQSCSKSCMINLPKVLKGCPIRPDLSQTTFWRATLQRRRRERKERRASRRWCVNCTIQHFIKMSSCLWGLSEQQNWYW